MLICWFVESRLKSTIVVKKKKKKWDFWEPLYKQIAKPTLTSINKRVTLQMKLNLAKGKLQRN